jgi:hypothetical protein
MKIGHSHSILAAYQAALPTPGESKRNKGPESASGRRPLEISAEGKRRSEDLQTARELQARMPDTPAPREEQISAVQERIGSGFYDTPEVRREISSLLLSIYAT